MSSVLKNKQRIRIKLKGFDYKLIDKSALEIVMAGRRTGARIKGPIPFPVRKQRYTVLISPHVNKDARDKYEIRAYTRVIYVIQPAPNTMDTLMKLGLPGGVCAEVQVEED